MDEKKLSDALDRLAIREQIDNYIDALNHRDWQRLGETLSKKDFVWRCSEPTEMQMDSHDAMIEMVSSVQQYQFGFVFQMGHGVVIEEINGNRARARHTLHVFGNSFQSLGLYYDELVKENDGVWRFRRRDYQITYYEESPMTGRIYRQLPDPDYKKYPLP